MKYVYWNFVGNMIQSNYTSIYIIVVFVIGGDEKLTEESQKAVLLDKLYREHFRKLFIYARSALKDSNLAEEAVQDTFRIACDKLDQVTGSKNPAGWLMNTLKNVIRNMEKSRSSLYSCLRDTVEYNENFAASTSDEINIDLLYEGLISKEDFELLKCIVLEKYSYLEAAKRFGITLETCKKRIQRIKKDLRRKLRQKNEKTF